MKIVHAILVLFLSVLSSSGFAQFGNGSGMVREWEYLFRGDLMYGLTGELSGTAKMVRGCEFLTTMNGTFVIIGVEEQRAGRAIIINEVRQNTPYHRMLCREKYGTSKMFTDPKRFWAFGAGEGRIKRMDDIPIGAVVLHCYTSELVSKNAKTFRGSILIDYKLGEILDAVEVPATQVNRARCTALTGSDELMYYRPAKFADLKLPPSFFPPVEPDDLAMMSHTLDDLEVHFGSIAGTPSGTPPKPPPSAGPTPPAPAPPAPPAPGGSSSFTSCNNTGLSICGQGCSITYTTTMTGCKTMCNNVTGCSDDYKACAAQASSDSNQCSAGCKSQWCK